VDVILDTDLVTILLLGSQPAAGRLQDRLRARSDVEAATTIITLQEQMQGRLASVNRCREGAQFVREYARLQAAFRSLSEMKVLPFDDAAQTRFDELQSLRLRVGTMDLRIASIALATGSVVLTRNLRDFTRVPGLIAEDWTL
jgi:tRNA(fMet)-specific endonuclease VapC